MEILLNGESRSVADDLDIQRLLDTLQVKAAGVVVEMNGNVVERSRFAETKVKGGDKLEVVRLVGGG